MSNSSGEPVAKAGLARASSATGRSSNAKRFIGHLPGNPLQGWKPECWGRLKSRRKRAQPPFWGLRPVRQATPHRSECPCREEDGTLVVLVARPNARPRAG